MTAELRVAEINRDRLQTNLQEALRATPEGAVLDLRWNAYGHGLGQVAEVAADCGIGRVLMNENFSKQSLPSSFRVIEPAELTDPLQGLQLIDAETVFGLAAGQNHSQAVLTLSAAVINSKRVPAGHGLSYNFRVRTEVETWLALVPLGYADGITRSARTRAEASCRGARYPLNSTIAMDQFILETGEVQPEIGERVYLFGAGRHGEVSSADWAAQTGVHPLALISGIGPRVTRKFEA